MVSLGPPEHAEWVVGRAAIVNFYFQSMSDYALEK